MVTKMVAGKQTLVIRSPSHRDGGAVYQLVKASPPLDVNSSYSYLLWCDYFADTSCVAWHGSSLVGYVSGFLPHKEQPPKSAGGGTTLFIWQVAVAQSARGTGVGYQMLSYLWAKWQAAIMLTTVSPSNLPSMRLFSKFASSSNATLSLSNHYPAELFSPRTTRRRVFAYHQKRCGQTTIHTQKGGAGTGNRMSNSLKTFDRYESNVRSYVRSFPTVFKQARGAVLIDTQEKRIS